MRRLITQLPWLIVAVVCITTAVDIALIQLHSQSYAQPQAKDRTTVIAAPVDTAPPKTVIDPNNTFLSWGAVVALLAVAGTAITAMVTSRIHIANVDIHPTSGILGEKYSTRADCVRKHQEVNDSFQRVYDKIEEVRSSVTDGNTKIVGDLSYIRAKLEEK